MHESNSYLPIAYTVYLLISIALTVWVARTLHKNGRPFLVDAFSGNNELADSVNHLLVVGFYLINFGYVSLVMRSRLSPTNVAEVMELASGKIGRVLIVLGFMHFFNLFVFSRIRSRANETRPTPPEWTGIPVEHEVGRVAAGR